MGLKEGIRSAYTVRVSYSLGFGDLGFLLRVFRGSLTGLPLRGIAGFRVSGFRVLQLGFGV